MSKDIITTPTTTKNGIMAKNTDKFKLDLIGIHEEFMLLFQGKVGNFYKQVNDVFGKAFGDRIKLEPFVFEKKDIPLLAILINLKNFDDLYEKVIIEDALNRKEQQKINDAARQNKTDVKGPSSGFKKIDKSLSDAYSALGVRLQHLQCKLMTTYILIESSPKIIYPLVAKHKGFLRSLAETTFVREPSMMTHFPNEPAPTYQSTFKHIANKLLPIEKDIRQMITVFNMQWYGPNYQGQGTPDLQALVDQFAPLGLDSEQTDLFYLFRAFTNVPELTPKQLIQWNQYIRDGSELITLILTYRNPQWDYLSENLSTHRINIPVSRFFARSTETHKVEPLSNTTFAIFLGCYGRFIGLLWLILMSKALEHYNSLPKQDVNV